MHVNATRHPTDAWVAQQLREATPFDQHPVYLICDNDRKYGEHFVNVAAEMEVLRRECLDHILILSEKHLRRVVQEYVCYFNEDRSHQDINQRIPSAPISWPVGEGEIVACPMLSGLHHAYSRKVA